MEKFNSQQDALRTALAQVLGTVPSKGSLVISDEQRQQVGTLMMGWLKEERWSIRPGTRASQNPLNYIVGKQPTCLIEAWVQPKQAKPQVTLGNSKFDLIKAAVEAGIISKEEGAKQFMALLETK
jgi:hypothetical protein